MYPRTIPPYASRDRLQAFEEVRWGLLSRVLQNSVTPYAKAAYGAPLAGPAPTGPG